MDTTQDKVQVIQGIKPFYTARVYDNPEMQKLADDYENMRSSYCMPVLNLLNGISFKDVIGILNACIDISKTQEEKKNKLLVFDINEVPILKIP